uniref:FAD-dependent monooxygenase DEP2 ) n=1 Tax=Ganoderma boninense TaxID=34458 RepID=A0A5K1K2W4_9APHY|nr:FAD-dependent monooxygenase DEP2 (EC (Depudecin biosynthesis cluster protein 2) [Ganoderma boninense]
MTALHAYFTLRNQQAFQRLLDPSRGQHRDSGGLSTSGGKSWSRPSPLSSAQSVDVNSRDHLGRTVLHLAATSQDASAPEFVRLLLAHPTINVNVIDAESHWTPLHRALYHGNIATAQLLLQRPDIDTSVRDIEGYTPFDLYNSTVEGTVPDHFTARGQELYTWGSNRNAALGVGDGDDRAIPELVSLRLSAIPETEKLDARFTPIRVRQIAMSRLHTVIVTDEPRGNIRLCGFGSGGRLGPGQHTQYTPIPIPGFNLTVESVAVGQDHTLILTKNGEVHSWGLNRFAQLGYVVETVTGGRAEEPIQSTQGKSQPVQAAPRVVTKVNKPVLSVSITDSALACLLETQEVICLWNDGHFKVNFPAYSFPSEFVAYRPPQAANRNSASIDKMTSCEDTFAALSSSGELFTFTLPSPPDGGASSSKSRFNVQPQRVWALRKQFSAVRDVALGVDGSIIVCTESGHVFVRSRNLKAGQGSSGKAFKFQRVPYIQRITQVCANATGAFAALRSDWESEEVQVVGNQLSQDLAAVQPVSKLIPDQHSMATSLGASSGASLDLPVDLEQGSDEEEEDAAVHSDIKQLKILASVILRFKEARKGIEGARVLDLNNMPYSADLVVHVQSNGIDVPAHRVILAARSAALNKVLLEAVTIRDTKSSVAVQGHVTKGASQRLARVTFVGCHPLTVLILLAYLYSDEPLAVWDHRVSHTIQRQLEQLKVKPVQLKAELQALASLLELKALSDVLDAPVKRTPKPALAADLQRLFSWNQSQGVGDRTRIPLAPDVGLQLAEREVYCHSVVLRARSPFFAAFFDDKDWTAHRWTPEGTVVVNLKHMKWRAVEPVLKFICTGGDREIFDIIEDVRSVDELIDYMFDVMAVANELHVDRLMLICSWVIMKRVWINNVCSVLSDATHYNATALVRLAQEYIAVNMEVFLESRMLEDLGSDLVKQLSTFVRSAQARKYPLSRSTRIVDKAMEAWGDWLALQDIPQPLVPTSRTGAFRDSPKLSPPGPGKRTTKRSDASVPNSPMLRPTFSNRPVTTGIPDDEMFMMDETEPATSAPTLPGVSAPGMPPRVPSGSDSPGRPAPGWKTITSAPKADMKTIMAEATSAKSAVPQSPRMGPARPSDAPRSLSSRPSMEPLAKSGSIQVSRVPSGSSWRVPQPVASTPISGSPGASSLPSTPSKEARVQPSVPSHATSSTAAAGAPSTMPRSQPTTPRKPAASGLGPVFTPTKQASPASSSIRRVVSGNVWTPPPVQPVQPVVQSSSRPAVSFAAIQLSQAQQDAPLPKDKRSLVEIQEEERARQVEEDFLRWWAEEEERLRQEEAAAAAILPTVPRTTKKSKGSQKGKGSGAASAGDGRAQQQQQHQTQKGGKGPGRQPREKHGSTKERQGEPKEQAQQGQGGKPHRRRPAQTSSDGAMAKGDAPGMPRVQQLPS